MIRYASSLSSLKMSDRAQADKCVQELVAGYLKEHGLPSTYEAFKAEVGRSFDGLDSSPVVSGDLDSIVKDYLDFNAVQTKAPEAKLNSFTPQHLQNIAKFEVQFPGFEKPYVSKLEKLPTISDALVIHSSYLRLPLGDDEHKHLIAFVSADKCITFYDTEKKHILAQHKDTVNSRLVLSYKQYILTCNMNGEVVFWNLVDDSSLQRLKSFKLHKRLITSLQVIPHETNVDEVYLCSIGYDFKLCLHKLNVKTWENQDMGEFRFMTNPTCLDVRIDAQTCSLGQIFVGLLESSLVHVFHVSEGRLEPHYKIALNDSEFGHHSFYPTSVLVYGDLLLAATNHTPYMRLITAHIPRDRESDVEIRRDLVISNINTMSPQDKYSNTPILRRPENRGVVLIGDDGVVRGVDLANGSVLELLDIQTRSRTACISENAGSICVCTVDKAVSLIHF